MQTHFLRAPALTIILSILLVLVTGCDRDRAGEKLRLLTWVGYDEPSFLDPLKEELGVDIEVTTYVGGDQMYTLFTTAPAGTYDAIVVDAEYGDRMYQEELLQSLPRSTWFDHDLFSIFQDGDPVKTNTDVYAAVMRWGALGLVFNHAKVEPAKANSYDLLWEETIKGRVVVFDWYLPVMGVLSVAKGNPTPFRLSSGAFDELTDSLVKLRMQVGTIHPGTGQVIEDLRSGAAWVGPGIGEWAAAVLAAEGLPIDWVVPREGGVMWIEGFAIPTTAPNPQLASRFIRLVREPEHLARLAWRDAYHSQVVRMSAYEFLNVDQRSMLKAEDLTDIADLISRLHVRRLPSGSFGEEEWLRAWQRFKTTRTSS